MEKGKHSKDLLPVLGIETKQQIAPSRASPCLEGYGIAKMEVEKQVDADVVIHRLMSLSLASGIAMGSRRKLGKRSRNVVTASRWSERENTLSLDNRA